MKYLTSCHTNSTYIDNVLSFFGEPDQIKSYKYELERPGTMFHYLTIYLSKTFCFTTGGYKGDKDGYAIPAGTDIFISVSGE